MSSDMLPKDRTRRDPFYEEPLPKAYYHPSPPRYLNKRDRKLAFQSPERVQTEQKISPADERFLKESNTYKTAMPTPEEEKDSSSKFDESWPASERPSSISFPESEFYPSPITEERGGRYRTEELFSKELSKFLEDPLKTHLDFDKIPVRDSYDKLPVKPQLDDKSKGGKTEESTLSKYIERFRHGVPRSREEREREGSGSKKDFWWLSGSPPTPSDSSTPKDDSNSTKTKGRTPGSLKSDQHKDARNPTSSSSSSLTTTALALHKKYMLDKDDKTRHLQERANKLVEKSESSLNSSDPIVSTDGLGSTTSGCPSTFEEESYRPSFIRSRNGKENFPTVGRPKKPEDDILIQWRMRRKMDAARERITSEGASGKYKSEVAMNDVESKLAQFRKRLAEGIQSDPSQRQLPTHTPFVSATDRPTHVLPAPGVSSQIPGVREIDVQTDNKVDAVIQTSDQGSPSREKNGSHHHSPVASPHLGRRRQANRIRHVEPHYHLSCDILPCKHGHEKKTGKFTEDSDSSFERMKKKHVNQMNNEDPSELDSFSSDIPVRDSVDKRRTDKKNIEHGSETEEEKSISNVVVKRTKEPQSRKKEQPGTISPEESDQDEGKNSSQTIQTVKEVKGGKMRREAKKHPAGDLSEELLHSSSRQGAALRHTYPTPQCSSSPVQPIHSTIGQVVGERLFTSSVEVATSIDTVMESSEYPTAAKESPIVKRGAQLPTHQEQLSHEESIEISDGEDFPEDDILKELRKKREQYLQRIQDIENMINVIQD